MTSPTLTLTITAADGATELLTVPYPPLTAAAPTLYTQSYTSLGNVAHANLPATMAGGGLPVQYQVEPAGSTSAPFIISNGKLMVTNMAGAPIGAYAVAGPLPAFATRVGIDFYLGNPGSTQGVVNASFLDEFTGGFVWPPPQYGAHVVVSPTYVQALGGASLLYTAAPFPLAQDYTTVHTLDLYRSGTTVTVFVDGINCGSSTGANVAAWSGNYVMWEISIGAATANQPAILAARVGCGTAIPVVPPTGTESPDGTSVSAVGPTINASPTPGTAGKGNALAITSGGQISLNGVVPPAYSATSGVKTLYYIDHTAFQQNSAGNWFGPITATSPGGAAFTATPAPTILLSSTSVASGAAVATTVGTLSVTTGLPSGTVGTGAYTWSYALSGTNAASFTISGSQLKTVGALADGSYNVTITAASGALTATLPVTVTVGTPPVPAGGFFDDFIGAAGTKPNPANWTLFSQVGGANNIANASVAPANVYLDGNSNCVIALTSAPPYYNGGYMIGAGAAANWGNGLWEARMKIPTQNPALWHAFWAFNGTAEIDMFEVGWPSGPTNGLFFNLHQHNPAIIYTYTKNMFPAGIGVTDFGNAYHTYFMRVSANQLQCGVDGTVLATFAPADIAPNSWIYNTPNTPQFLFIVNGNTPASLPIYYYIDYIRYTPG